MVNSPKSISNKCLLRSPLCILNSRLKICLYGEKFANLCLVYKYSPKLQGVEPQLSADPIGMRSLY